MRRPTMDSLLQHCAELGLQVQWAHLTGNLSGCYDHTTKTIWLEADDPEWMNIPNLMHELIHAQRGDDGHQPASIERHINRTVAHALITEDDYARAEQISGARGSGGIAQELGLPRWVVSAYRAELWQHR